MDNNRGEQQSAHAPHHPLISKLAFAIWDEAFAGHTELTARDAGPHPPSCPTMVVQIADASYRTWKQQLSPVSQSK